jgi:hypothetical protein
MRQPSTSNRSFTQPEIFTVMHRIQLKGPWEYRPLRGPETAPDAPEPTTDRPELPSQLTTLPAPGTVKFPASWPDFLGDFRGTVEFRRPFNCPTNLSPNDRVDIVLEGVGGAAEVQINGTVSGCLDADSGRGRFEITSKLRLHNVLRITIVRTAMTPEPSGLWGTVSLEILESPQS